MCIGQSLFSTLQSLTHPLNLSIWMFVVAISMSSFFSFWKLDGLFLWHELTKEPFIWHNFMFFLNSANHIRLFSVILESDIDAGYIHWTLTLFQSEKFQLKFSQYVCYIIWESCWTKIIGRLPKLTVSYIYIDESVWHPNTMPKCFRTRFVKRLRAAEKFIF